jgi:membrane fusion protein (multidrug efflux system)
MQTTKNMVFRTSLTALALGLALSACGDSHGGQKPHMGPAAVGVITVRTQRVTLDTELSGRTTPYTVAEVRPQIGGIILKRLFTEGAEVRAGQALYQIDPASYKASLDSAQAALDKARANLTTLSLKADRYQQLIAIHAVGQQDLDDALAAQKAAAADVAASLATVETARINLGYTRVISPVSGRVGKSSVTQGALVTADQANSLATVQQLDPIYVDVTQSMGELLQLKHDLASGLIKSNGANLAPVQLTLEDGSHYALQGKLQFSDVTVDPSTGAIALRAVFPNPRHELLPGMYVRARLINGVNDQAILVPQSSVAHDNKGNSIALVAGADGKAQLRMLQISRAIGSQWLVSAGLKPGDQLIVDGLQKIRPGAPVKAVPAAVDASAANSGV